MGLLKSAHEVREPNQNRKQLARKDKKRIVKPFKIGESGSDSSTSGSEGCSDHDDLESNSDDGA